MAYKIVTAFKLGEPPEERVYFRSLTRSGVESVLYEVGKPTHPRPGCGPLAAFDTLKNVELFKKKSGWGRSPVFRCRIKRETKETTLYSKGGITYSCQPSPQGTVLCKKIILTKRISQLYSKY